METREFIQAALDFVKGATMRGLDGLNQSELSWRPGPHANSIGLILYHQTRSEDTFVQSRIQGKPQVWESEKWYQKLNLPANDTGGHGYTAEQCASFPVPPLKDLLAYAEAVRKRTSEYLKDMTPDKFDRKINMPHFGDITVGAILALVISHGASHAGEISYLRGLQRGLDK